MKKFAIVLISLIAALVAAAQTPGFVKANDVTVNSAEMTAKKELLKQLKKDYKFSSATIEDWIDGQTYIVAKKQGKYSLFSLDGDPLLTYNGEVQWFAGVLPQIISGRTIFVLYNVMAETSRKGFASAESKIFVMPQAGVEQLEEIAFGDKVYFRGFRSSASKEKWPRDGYLYSLDGKKIFDAKDDPYHLLYDDKDGGRFFMGVKRWHQKPKIESYEVTHIKDSKGNLIDSVVGRYNIFVNHYGFGSDWASEASMTDISGNVNISVGYDTKLNSLISPEAKIVLDSISEATYYPATNQFVYKKIVGDDILMGLYDPANPSANIEPRYSEIEIDSTGQVLIRPTLLANQEKYTPGKVYERKFSCEAERLLEKVSTDSLFNAYKGKEYAAMSPEELICLSRGVIRLYQRLAWYQGAVLKHYSNPKPIFVETTKSADALFDGLNPTDFSAATKIINACIDQLRKFNTPDLNAYADILEDQNDRVLGSLLQTRDDLIPAAKKAYYERGEAATAEYEAQQERIRVEQEQLEAQRKQYEEQLKQQQNQRIMDFLMDIAQWAKQASIAYQKEQEAKRMSSKSAKGGSGRSSASASSSSDNGGGNSRAFLERQVADWEQKLKKAQESLAEAVRIAESTGTWEAKNVVKSKENTVREFSEELQKYKDQLRAL